MSWDAELRDDRGHVEGEWNYTHNCNKMATVALSFAVLHDSFADLSLSEPLSGVTSWFHNLDGRSGPEGAAILHKIITELQADPEKYRALNPANGWGDYDSFLAILVDMRDRVPEWPTTWKVCG
jgi:hypothetical protein